MTNLFIKTKFYIYILGTFLMLPFLFGGISHANDLLWDIFKVTKHTDTMLHIKEDKDDVGEKLIGGGSKLEVGFGPNGWFANSGKGPIIVKITKLLLMLTIALSVTMILYNGMVYIIQTGQGKESKSLIKNVILIVVGILVAIFSVVIINLIQSIPTTLDEEIGTVNFKESNNEHEIIE